MKNISILLFVSLAFFSCKKDKFKGQFILPIRNLTFSVNPAISPPGTYYIPINGAVTNIQNLLDANGMVAADVEAILPRDATLTVAFQDAKIDFVRDMSVRLCAIGDNQENCGREAFWRTDIPIQTSFGLGLNASNIDDLSDILLSEKINVQIKLEELIAQPSTTFDIVLDMEFEVR